MLKKNISRAEKAYSFTEDLYKFYSKEVNPIECSVNKLAVEIQDSIRKFERDNSDIMSGVRIDFSGFWPIYNEESENTEIELVPHLKIDDEFINFTFFELLKNSLKYAFNQGVNEKIIDITIEFDNENNFMLCYSDNGVGFKESDEDKIFEYSERMSNFNNEKIKGSGTGLWSMKNYLKDHGGDIIFKFPSEFIIKLPMYTIEES